MQTISKYFVALLVSFFSGYIDEPPCESDQQAGIHETYIQIERKSECNTLQKRHSDIENFI